MLSSMTQAEETRRRILDAATEEFARHGIAGARVDRVAQRSGMSKPMIYTYFSSKEGLFDAVFEAHVVANSDRVPFDAGDLAGYAVRLYDDYLADPALLRLVMWKRLERVETGYLFAGLEEVDAAHLADIAEAQRAGAIRTGRSTTRAPAAGLRTTRRRRRRRGRRRSGGRRRRWSARGRCGRGCGRSR